MRDRKQRKKVNTTLIDKSKLPPKTPAMTQPVGIDKDGKRGRLAEIPTDKGEL